MYQVPREIHPPDHCLLRVGILIWRILAGILLLIVIVRVNSNRASLDHLKGRDQLNELAAFDRHDEGIRFWAGISTKLAFFIWIITFALRRKTPILHGAALIVFIICLLHERSMIGELAQMGFTATSR